VLPRVADKILIVDDDPISRRFLKEVLFAVHPEYEFFFASNGTEAFEIIDTTFPDLILLDIMMPGTNGFRVCEKLKSIEKVQDIPVLLITGLSKIEEKVKGFKAGAADYITKPLNPEETVARVEAHLKIKQYYDELKQANKKLKNMQSRLIEKAKMAAIGIFTSGVAHEFSNILTMMSGYSQLALQTEKQQDLKESMIIINELTSRGKKIVAGLLDFSRENEYYAKKDTDITQIIEKCLLLMKKLLRDEGIEIRKAFDPIPEIKCHTNQMLQVFVNIIKNAIDAMSGMGKKILYIEVKQCVDNEQLKRYCGREKVDLNQSYIIIKFIDTGPGIPENLKERIFEPFITNKGVLSGGNDNTPGTGLGLSIAFGVIKRHNGFIFAQSKHGQGAVFTIGLPC